MNIYPYISFYDGWHIILKLNSSSFSLPCRPGRCSACMWQTVKPLKGFISHAEKQSQRQGGKQHYVLKLHSHKHWVCGRYTPQGYFRSSFDDSEGRPIICPDKAWLSAWTMLLGNRFPLPKSRSNGFYELSSKHQF